MGAAETRHFQRHYGRWTEHPECEFCRTPFQATFFLAVESNYGSRTIAQLASRMIEDPHSWFTYVWREGDHDLEQGSLMCYLEKWFRPLTQEEAKVLENRWPGQQLNLYGEKNFPASLAQEPA